MKKRFVLGVIGASLLSVSVAMAAGDPAKGKEKSALCTACHNADGNSTNPEWPSLAGQHASYTAKQLRNFKDETGGRANATMAGMVAALSPEDMDDVAAYFAQQTAKPAGVADPELVTEGETLFRGGDFDRGIAACTGCHGPAGNGNPAAAFPTLAGQHAKYTEIQLHAFRRQERSNDPNQVMRDIASRMSDRQIQAVASYMQGLRP